VTHAWLSISRDDLLVERLQAEQEGRDLDSVQGEFDALLAEADPEPLRSAALLDRIQDLPTRPGYVYDEPSDLAGIRSRTGVPPSLPPVDLGTLEDRIHGAWLGRSCGCLLGKVTEGWRRPTMEGFLKETDQWPLHAYISKGSSAKIREGFGVQHRRFWIEEVECMPEDDDMNYTVVGLEILKRYGRDFTPEHVAEFWMENIPVLHVCTAERVAYKNFVNGFHPPESASSRNPYREWIGAQIRADFWGYANPANPAAAAELAWRDACVSHVKNGIYGEMWAAAMIAAAFVMECPRQAIEVGLAVVPPASRFSESVLRVLAWRNQGLSASQASERIHEEWDETRSHDWCHTISNAMIVTMALLWGDRDFERTICLAVQACFDTDCNGATSGSVLGAMLGASKLPEKWTGPLNDTLETGVQGYHRVRIGDLAARSLEVARTRSASS